MNCCDVVSNPFQVFDMMHVVLLVIQDLSQFKNKHEPVAISVAVDDSACGRRAGHSLANQD